MFKTVFKLCILFFFCLGPAFSMAQASGEAALADKYYDEGEYNSALELYEKLNRQDPLNRHYVYRISSCFDKARNYDAAIKFLEKAIRREPEAYELEVMKAAEMEKSGDGKGSEKVLNELISKKLSTIGDFSLISGFFLGMNNTDRAVETLIQARKVNKNDHLFATELAEIFQRQGKFDLATTEYLKLYAFDPLTYPDIRQNILNLVSPTSATAVEKILLEAVQRNQKDVGIRTLVYDFYVLNEQFMEAFIQIKSIDKVFNESGDRVFQFAMTMRSNHNYTLANKALDYVIENHPQSSYYFQAYQEKTVNGELEAFEKIPLDSLAIRNAVKSYEDLLNTFGRNPSFFDAIYRKSRLQAFYLFDLKSALEELEAIVAMPLKPKEKAQANLLIGDIYLMQKEFNKAKLKYSEVDTQFKEEQIGALAKFKDGQLSYYKGDFDESQARLKSIKDNTSN